MKISYNWIKEYLNIDHDPAKVADILTNVGLEIEGTEEWQSAKGGLEGVVIGEVLSCNRHPDADRLTVVTVDTGQPAPLSIVCGAPNVKEGQKVPVATVGTTLYKDDKSMEIKKVKIRGEVSEGMICAEDELGLGDSHEGIMVLDEKARPGASAAEYFNITRDFVFEIGLTPNRIDGGSHYGVARDLAAYLNVNEGLKERARLPSLESFKPDNNRNIFEVIIENKEDCPRYTGVTISGVTVGGSPDWLKNRLRAIGLNPINNVVDITNYVQHEIGQPLHSFDADKIEGRKIIIRNLPEKSRFTTLDEMERELSSKDLMICNEKEGMCIAGVFGGIKSGVTGQTKNIFLESAYFNPVAIRKTARRHGLQTDASFRFERGTDPNNVTWALKRAAMMIKEIAGGEISSGVVDVYPEKIERKSVKINFENVNRLTGKEISRSVIKRIVTLLDFEITRESPDHLEMKIPTYRVDVEQEADVIEEILRIYGYNNIEISNNVHSNLSYSDKPDKEKLINVISDLLSAKGFSEIMCNSLNPAAWYEQSDDFSKEQLVTLANPLSSDLNAMRQSLLYGGLSTIIRNINRQNSDLRLYEFGQCYFSADSGKTIHGVENFIEKSSLDLFITGNSVPQSWNYRTTPSDFFHIKSFVEMVLSRLGLDPGSFCNGESGKGYYSESLTYSAGDNIIATAGRIAKHYLSVFDINQDVYYGHIEWDSLVDLAKSHSISFRELPKYPSVRRDLALLIDRKVKYSDIRDLAFKTEKVLLREVSLFDVYQNDEMGKDNKSYAVSFILRDDNDTLTDEKIDKVMDNLISVFRKKLNARIR